jgi:hypothetical protein
VGLALAALLASLACVPATGPVEISIDGRLDGTGDSGAFVLRGAVADAGRVYTRPLTRVAAQETHARRTLVGRRGRLVLRLDGEANFFAVNLHWRIVSATGAYAGLRGGGSGRDTILPGGRLSSRLRGVVRGPC